MDTYLDVLDTYASSTGALLGGIREPVQEKLPDYTITVHGIKSSSRSIGAEEIGGMAEALEAAANKGNMEYILAHNGAFIEEAQMLITALGAFLKNESLADPRPLKKMPQGELLSALLGACEAYDMDGADAAMDEIMKYNYQADGGLALWLKKNVEEMNFKGIVERLKAMDLNKI